MKNGKTKRVTVRNLQHNLATYLEMAKIAPIVVTRRGKDEVLIVNPVEYSCVKNANKPRRVRDTKFIGMYKDRKDWEGLSNSEVAGNLRSDSWYGK